MNPGILYVSMTSGISHATGLQSWLHSRSGLQSWFWSGLRSWFYIQLRRRARTQLRLRLEKTMRAEADSSVPDCYDALAVLEAWRSKEKCRWVKIEIGDGYGATCWRVELHRGPHAVYCSETTFIKYIGVNPEWQEHEGDLYCCVVAGDSLDDWPGLAATIRKAIECAEKFWSA